MSAFGYTVNVITLLALSLSVGLLIDDAIVVRENIFRHMEKLRQGPAQGRRATGTSEVGLAVTATTLTLVAVFLPVAFTTGIAGKFFRQFGITVAAAVLISLFEAFTFAPMLSAYFFKKATDARKRRFPRGFQDLVAAFYDRPGQQLPAGPALVAQPPPDHDRPDHGRRLRRQRATSSPSSASGGYAPRRAAGVQSRRPDRLGQLARPDRPGRPAPGGSPQGPVRDRRRDHGRRLDRRVLGRGHGQRQAQIPSSEAAAFQDHLRPLLSGLPGMTITFQEATSMGGAAFASMQQLPIQINIKGTNLADMTKASEDIKAALLKIPGLVDINSDNRPPKPEIQIQVDRERASRLGAGTAVRSPAAMRSLVDGDLASKYREGEKLIDIRVRASEDIRENLEQLSPGLHPDRCAAGRSPWTRSATLRNVNGPTQIRRSRPDPPDHDRGQHPPAARPSTKSPRRSTRPWPGSISRRG